MPDLHRRAVSLEIEELARAMNNSKKEQDMKLDQLVSKENTALRFPGGTSSSIGQLLR